jgi:(p)ppGpp synthase/HD superfamily hydrolase
MAGFLHDILEDTAYGEKDLIENFGIKVLNLVKEASEPEHNSKIWEDRKKHTIESLTEISLDGLKVVIADKINNLESMNNDYFILGEDLWFKFNASKDRQKWYYTEMKKIFETRLPSENMLMRRFLDYYKIFEI